jgi:hypothetical protein
VAREQADQEEERDDDDFTDDASSKNSPQLLPHEPNAKDMNVSNNSS